jgi:hypothetical protein
MQLILGVFSLWINNLQEYSVWSFNLLLRCFQMICIMILTWKGLIQMCMDIQMVQWQELKQNNYKVL